MKNKVAESIKQWPAFARVALPVLLAIAGIAGCAPQLIPGQLEALKSQLVSTLDTALSLEGELGYGGLIHNFKNSVLRPEESAFAVAAAKNAQEARRHSKALETTASDMGLTIDLSEVSAMIAAYEQRLETVAQMSKRGQTARDIDSAVRFNDQYALAAISVSLDKITNAIYDEITQLQQLVFLFVLGAMLAILIGFFGYQSFAQSRRELSRVTAMNTALDEANSDLSAANLSIGQFAGIASHDLRAPIRHIAFFASDLEKNATSPDHVKDVAKRLSASADRMNALVGSLLEFSKLQFKVPEITSVQSANILRDCLSELERELAAADAVVDIDLNELPDIEADENLLLRVFSNLIGNALKYTRPGTPPRISILAEQTPQNTIFHVEDNGIGIDPRYREQIFEPMQRLHGQNEYSGVGIGLSLVKSIVESHRGSVWVTAAQPHGSRFSFSIPKYQKNSKTPAHRVKHP